jgi:hypothetical protein
MKHIHFAFVNSEVLIDFFSEIELKNHDLSVLQEIKNGLVELKLPIPPELIERWKEPPNI